MDFVQLCCLAQMSHHVLVESQGTTGSIHVHSGQVTHAEVEALQGEGAFCEILAWESGCFEMSPLPEERTASINRTWEYLLIEAMRYGNERGGVGKAEGSTGPQISVQGFCGNLRAIALTDLVQLACMARTDRVIQIEADSLTGRLYVQGGQVCHAQSGELKGEDAFCEMLKAGGGAFMTLPGEEVVEETIAKPWEYLLIDAMRFLDEQASSADEEAKREGLAQRLQRMKVSEKIRLAITADKETRGLLIRDASRMVQLAIINNPRITEGEVTSIAYSRNVDEEVLRRIAHNREWMRLYQVRAALVKNPKTPLPISLKVVQTLQPQDLKEISRSKSVPIMVANVAKKHVMDGS
jgi:hypothetical protein